VSWWWQVAFVAAGIGWVIGMAWHSAPEAPPGFPCSGKAKGHDLFVVLGNLAFHLVPLLWLLFFVMD
jgi:hypothetical protein